MAVLLVTGAGRGIGAATALHAARNGWSVAVNFRSDTVSAARVVETIHSEGGSAIAIQADVSREEEILRMFAECEAQLGVPYGLVNNAATLEKQMRLDEMDAARMHRMFTANSIGPMLCAREAVKRMSTRHGRKGGVIVNVTSVAARGGSPGEYTDYAASKGAIETFTIGLAKEVAEEGIRVNGVRPGYIYTEMHALGGEPNRVERVKAGVPMKRGGRPEEVAAAIVWLLSEQASYVTGTILDVSGGR